MKSVVKSILLKHQSLFGFLLFCGLIMIIFLIALRHNKNRIHKILKNAAFTTGKFTGEVKPIKKGSNGPWYVCLYNVKGNDYTTSEPVHLFENFNMKFFYKTFPVIFDSTDPNDSEVLIFPFEFEEFNIKYPDSLKSRLNKD